MCPILSGPPACLPRFSKDPISCLSRASMRREQRTTTKSNPIAGRPSPCSSPRTVATTRRADSLDEDGFDYIERLYHPRRDEDLGFFERVEDFSIEKLITKFRVEALTIAVL